MSRNKQPMMKMWWFCTVCEGAKISSDRSVGVTDGKASHQ